MNQKIKIQYFASIIDECLSDFINAILHHEKFQRLESVWRGLNFLLTTNTTENVKIKILDITWNEIELDLNNEKIFEQTILFEKIHSEEFDIPGGEPFGLLIGDFYLNHKNQKTLEKIGQICGSCFSPMIFGVEDIFAAIKNSDENSRFIGLTATRILGRASYNNLKATKNFCYLETVSKKNEHLWLNCNFIFAASAIKSFVETSWLANIITTDSTHNYIKNFTRERCNYDDSIYDYHPITNVQISKQNGYVLAEKGIICFCEDNNKQYANFFYCPTLNSSLNIDQLLCVSRFAHYIKVIMRDRIGSFSNAAMIEEYLQNWLQKYVASAECLSDEVKAKYPLKYASVTVSREKPDTGSYNSTIKLQLHDYANNIKHTKQNMIGFRIMLNSNKKIRDLFQNVWVN